jgi:hypothetical protein
MDRRTGVLLVVDYLAVSVLAVGITLWLTPSGSTRRWAVWGAVLLVPVVITAVRQMRHPMRGA